MAKIDIIEEKKDWRAEEDARTLMEYEKIMEDKKRKEKAIEALKEREKEIKNALKGE